MITQCYKDHNDTNSIQSQSCFIVGSETPGEQSSKMGDGAYTDRHPAQCAAREAHDACVLPSSFLLWVHRPCIAHSKRPDMISLMVGLKLMAAFIVHPLA